MSFLINRHVRWIVCLFLLVITAIPAVSRGVEEITQGGNLIASLKPVRPEPGDSVTVILSSFEVDLDRAAISWELDGKRLISNAGKKTFIFSLPSSPSRTTTVKATVTVPGGKTLEKTLVFQFLDFDLIWEAETYVPPFYRGKALPTDGSLVRIAVLAPSSETPAKDFVYVWKKGGKNLPTLSGQGQNTFVFEHSRRFASDVAVEVSSLKSGAGSEKRLLLSFYQPLLILYQSMPLIGTAYWQALTDSLPVGQNETILVAEPYYFPLVRSGVNNPRFIWRSRGENIAPNQDSNRLLIKGQEGSRGEVPLEVLAETGGPVPLEASRKLNLLLGNALNF